MTQTNNTNPRYKPLSIILGGLLIISILSGVFAYTSKTTCESNKCGESYLGVCFDKESIFYKCNTETEMCSLPDWDSANVIKYMEENKIVIYGSSNCGWCQKQLQEFGGLVNGLLQKELYIDCANSGNNKVCEDVASTPTWKKDGKVVGSGYKPLSEIISNFS